MKLTLLLLPAIFLAGCGYGTKTVSAPVPGTAPVISQLAPNSMKAGSGGFVLTVNGSSFASNATVNLNGTAQTATVVTQNQLTTNVPASAIANPGTIQVTVTNPAIMGTGPYDGGTAAATSTAATFTVN